jgi:hypothetical protein
MYTQVTALGLLAVYAYLRGAYWLYALAGIAALYSQYLGAALLVALNAHWLIWWRTHSRRDSLRWVAANGVVALAFAPWLPTFIDQQSHALNTSPRTAIGLASSTLIAYGGGLASGDIFLWTGGALCALALVGFAVSRNRRASSLALLLWAVPLGLVLFLGLRSGLFELRYLVLGIPGLVLLAAESLRRVKVAPLMVLALPAGLGLNAQYFDPALARDDYRGLVATIERSAQPGDAIMLVAPNQAEVFGYYYRGPLPMIGLPAQRPIDAQDTVQRLEALRSAYQRVWLVSWAMGEADPKGVISNWLAENGFQATHQWYGSVQLALVGFPSGDITTRKVDAALDNGIVLDAYRISSWTLSPGETLELTLVWRAAGGPTAERWKVFTHLLDPSSKVVAQRDAEPADNLRPTTGWQRGEQVEDNYGIVLPGDLPAGAYTLEIGMYSGQRRSVFDGSQDHLVLGQVTVVARNGAG